MDPIEPVFLRPVEAARMLSIARTRMYELLNAGSISAVRLEGGRGESRVPQLRRWSGMLWGPLAACESDL
jgi:predicted site-specific integrase-resolvase